MKSPTGGNKAGSDVMSHLKIAVIIVSILLAAGVIFFLHYLLIKCITNKGSVEKYQEKKRKIYLKKYTNDVSFELSQFRYDQTDWAFWLDTFDPESQLKQLVACEHVFHSECLDEYFKIK